MVPADGLFLVQHERSHGALKHATIYITQLINFLFIHFGSP